MTFSGSKGGTGKTTLSISISVAASGSVRTLLVDASSEGGATSYLLGDAPPPYLRDDPEGSLRQLEYERLQLTVAVNRGPLRDPGRVAEALREWRRRFPLVVVDVPALTDHNAVDRYYPIFEGAEGVIIVTEPNPAATDALFYTFGGRRVVVVLNCPRPYPKIVVDSYAKVVAAWCRRSGADYVVIPYEPAVSRLTSSTLRVLNYTSPEFDSAIAKLVGLLLRKRKE